MTVILGIDAAWTEKEPSGVAVLAFSVDHWRCAGIAPSYDSFISLADGTSVKWNSGRFRGCCPNVPKLLEAAGRLAGAPVDIVAVDLPIASVAISRRRSADNLISKEFGGRGCSTHSPNSTRPGALGHKITQDFLRAGYTIATADESFNGSKLLLEVYPHPALMVLLQQSYRIPYKVSKSRKYYRDKSIRERITALLAEFAAINEALSQIVGPTGIILPESNPLQTLSALKPYEDAIDALVSAWVGICYVNGAATPYGDTTAAIWVPIDQDCQVLFSALQNSQKLMVRQLLILHFATSVTFQQKMNCIIVFRCTRRARLPHRLLGSPFVCGQIYKPCQSALGSPKKVAV